MAKFDQLVEAYNQVCEQNVSQAPAQPAAVKPFVPPLPDDEMAARKRGFNVLTLGNVLGGDPRNLAYLAAALTGRPATSFSTSGHSEDGLTLPQAVTQAQNRAKGIKNDQFANQRVSPGASPEEADAAYNQMMSDWDKARGRVNTGQ